ncbi:MAG: hypothetical protein ACRDJC_05535, partial [Thermomicrobiales bacterium]
MSEREARAIDRNLLLNLAALVGVDLSPERAEALESQAEPHFAQLRGLDAVTEPNSEPAAEFRLEPPSGGGGTLPPEPPSTGGESVPSERGEGSP